MPGEVGDPVYISPEQLVGGAWDARADIYALGMIAYQLFGGQIPKFENLTNILRIKQERRFPSLRESRTDIPAAFEDELLRALAVDPNERPVSAGSWFAMLQTSLSSQISRVTVEGPVDATVDVDGSPRAAFLKVADWI